MPEILKQKLEANRRRDYAKKTSLAKLKMEIDELNKLYSGGRQVIGLVSC